MNLRVVAPVVSRSCSLPLTGRSGHGCALYLPLLFAALTGRSGHGFALYLPLLFAALTGRSAPGLSL